MERREGETSEASVDAMWPKTMASQVGTPPPTWAEAHFYTYASLGLQMGLANSIGNCFPLTQTSQAA